MNIPQTPDEKTVQNNEPKKCTHFKFTFTLIDNSLLNNLKSFRLTLENICLDLPAGDKNNDEYRFSYFCVFYNNNKIVSFCSLQNSYLSLDPAVLTEKLIALFKNVINVIDLRFYYINETYFIDALDKQFADQNWAILGTPTIPLDKLIGLLTLDNPKSFFTIGTMVLILLSFKYVSVNKYLDTFPLNSAPIFEIKTRFTRIAKQNSIMTSSTGVEEDSSINKRLPKRMAPKCLPGVYVIHCLLNNKRYYGESVNVSNRISQHKYGLEDQIDNDNCKLAELRRDWRRYKSYAFECYGIFYSKESTKAERQAIVAAQIARNPELCYNKVTKSSKKQKEPRVKGRLRVGLAIILKGVQYPSIAEASRETKHSRYKIKNWLNNRHNTDCIKI